MTGQIPDDRRAGPDDRPRTNPDAVPEHGTDADVDAVTQLDPSRHARTGADGAPPPDDSVVRYRGRDIDMRVVAELHVGGDDYARRDTATGRQSDLASDDDRRVNEDGRLTAT